MININEYILLPKEERQAHLNLDEACVERGGPAKGGLSSYCKGLMAHVLGTTIPSGKKIHVCHACNNAICSNPAHLYWGTAQENRHDYMATDDSRTIWERMVNKHGLEKATDMNRRVSNINGKGNKDKPKATEHKDNISLSINQMYAVKKALGINIVSNGGRPRAADYSKIVESVTNIGFKETAKEYNLSVVALKSRYYNAVKSLNK